jgi:integrase
MSSIKKQSNGRYQARFRDANGREHSQRFDKKKQAQEWLDGITTAQRTGAYCDPRAGRITVAALAPTWLQIKAGVVKPKTLAGYESLLKVQVLPRWGRVQVATITTADLEAWVSELITSGLSASRTRQAYLVVKGLLDTAVKARNLAVTPAYSVRLPPVPESSRRYLKMHQVEDLANAAGDYRLLILVLSYCGLRWGEAVALTVRNCDLLRSRLLVDRSVVDISGALSLGTTKTGRQREVPLPRSLRDELAVHVAGGSLDDLVFPAPRGGYLRSSNFRRARFDSAARAAGLEGLLPHELRHTAASLAIASGANIKVVQSMMGHSSATMTWDRYGHLYDNDLDSVAERLDTLRLGHLRAKCGQPGDSGHTLLMSVEATSA